MEISAKDAKQEFGGVLDKARHEPVCITKHGRPVAMVISVESYALMEAAYREAETERLIEEICADPKKLARLKVRLAQGVKDADAGRSAPADDVLDRLEAKYRSLADEHDV